MYEKGENFHKRLTRGLSIRLPFVTLIGQMPNFSEMVKYVIVTDKEFLLSECSYKNANSEHSAI